MKRLLLLAFVLIGLNAVISAVGLVWSIQNQHAIQRERVVAVLISCEDQNHRHDATIAQLDREGAAAVKKHPDQAASIEHTVAQFELIFSASTPKRDCAELARRYVGH